jgi:hypothetical protein
MRSRDLDIRHKRIAMLTIVAALFGLALSACAESQSKDVRPVGPRSSPPSNVRSMLEREEAAKGAQERLQKELAEASVRDLVERMDAESKQEREPFNSLGYREIRRRGREVGAELAREIQRQDRPSFIGILALRAVNRSGYGSLDRDMVVDVLVDRLRTNRYFNAWGLPHLYWEEAGDAVVEREQAAVEPLRDLLDDDRRAPVYGSEEKFESDRYKYRVKDYAFALLRRIEGDEEKLPTSPRERDRLMKR